MLGLWRVEVERRWIRAELEGDRRLDIATVMSACGVFGIWQAWDDTRLNMGRA